MNTTDAKHFLRQWSRATQRNRAQNIFFHYDKHGDTLSLREYLAAAERFQRLAARTVRNRADGTTLYVDRNGRFLIVNTATGLIVSYGKNS